MRTAKIIVVEDEVVIALHAQQQLTRLGYEVAAIVSSGERALKKIIDLRPDVVLMDIHIEGDMDGIEVAALIPAELDIPVIYVTAYSEEPTLERARATKPYGYLIKPYSEPELHATIQMALERRRGNSALRASEHRFRTIFDAINEGIFVVDPGTGGFLDVNEPGAVMFGYARDELIGRGIETLSSGIPPFTQHGAREWIDEATVSGQAQRFDWNCKTKDGRVFRAEISVRFASMGRHNVMLFVVRDLTEREAIEAQLRQSQRMEAIGQLTSGMAHDFTNLLGIIVGNLDLLRSARPNDAELDELSGEALDAARGGADLARRLLAFARRQPLEPRPIDLKALVGDMAKLLNRFLGENIEISLNLDDDLPRVCADPTQLEAAIANLATNARDAMPRGGILTIASARRTLDADYAAQNRDVRAGEYVMIEVKDTGAGMSPDVIDRVFEPFYTTKGRDHATGLGLSMVSAFLKQSGGHISVHSEVGAGTSFRLYLPCTFDAAVANALPQTSPIAAGKGETILVVEDNIPLRRVAVRQLREAGYSVLEAKNGSEALTQLRFTKVDVLFTDIVMRGDVDGLELARSAKNRQPSLGVILTTGFPESTLQKNIGSAKFRVLSKPYRMGALLRIVREVLDQTGAGVAAA